MSELPNAEFAEYLFELLDQACKEDPSLQSPVSTVYCGCGYLSDYTLNLNLCRRHTMICIHDFIDKHHIENMGNAELLGLLRPFALEYHHILERKAGRIADEFAKPPVLHPICQIKIGDDTLVSRNPDGKRKADDSTQPFKVRVCEADVRVRPYFPIMSPCPYAGMPRDPADVETGRTTPSQQFFDETDELYN